MSLRLTLRTLLAYLDDTLEPAQAKLIGQKVAESESARELMERIKQVTRRRRLTTPPTSGPGGVIDPNTVAEYLDNEVTPEQAAEVEQICLSSDVHLAEVAACHQILTLILGEPVNPPASAKQRMVGLVKGPEAIASRKPSPAKAKGGAEPVAESRDIDETLRLGLPPLARTDGWRNPLLLVGGGFLAALLLIVAVFQLLHLSEKTVDQGDDVIAQGKGPTNENKGDATIEKKDVAAAPEKKGSGEEPAGEPKDKQVAENKEPAPKATAIMDFSFNAPDPREGQIGNYYAEAKDTGILLQAGAGKNADWKRLTAKKSEVYSNRPLLSLPGSRSVVQTNRGVRVMLWGNMTPEFIYAPPLVLFESKAVLYFDVPRKTADELDLDVLLQRGRIVLTSTRSDRPVKVRVRFENPMIPSDKDILERQEHFDIQLMAKGASVLVDRWSDYPASEPFSPKAAKDPRRIGPLANVACMVLSGTVYVRTADLAAWQMTAPPGPAFLYWNSVRGPQQPMQLAKPFDAALDNPPLAPGLDPKFRLDMIRACENLSVQLATKEVDVALANAVKSTDPAMRRLGVRCQAAVGDLSGLLEDLDQPNVADLRTGAIDALRDWIAAGRDNEYKLFDALKEKYKNKEAEIIVGLLHGFSDTDQRRPGLYELLIDYLVNSNLAIRELGAWRLYKLVPAGKTIPYNAAADSQLREAAEARWRLLIPAGQLPPSVAPAGKKK